MGVGAGINKLTGNSQFTSSPADAPLQNGRYPQFFADLPQGLIGPFVLHGRGAGDDLQVADLG
ncbi:hypothetical protein ES703_111854 [subsurface metagenome]